jgi:hypothetical protein
MMVILLYAGFPRFFGPDDGAGSLGLAVWYAFFK